MRVIARSTLESYAKFHAPFSDRDVLRQRLRAWFSEVHKASWKSSAELKQQFSSASIVSADRVVFNIKGNHYRLVTAIDYLHGMIFIKWIGTHGEYDKIDVSTVEYSGKRYDNPAHPH